MVYNHTPVNLPELESKQIKKLRWYITPSGDHYPSITSILGYGPKPWLDDWRQSLGASKADIETKRCADRGTAVHEICEKVLNNHPNPTLGHEHEHILLFNKIKLALPKINNILAQEIALYSDTLGIAGRVDCIAEYKGIPSIIDFKTSNNLKTDEMIQDYYMQETFYALAFYELTGIEITQIVTIIAVEKGMLPQIMIKSIYPYIVPLSKKIKLFYDNYN